MILLSSSLAVLCLLNIWTIGYAAGCGDGQDEVDGRCCDLCPPGEYMYEFCSEHKQTVCRPCKEGYFADQPNMFDRCEKCRSCQQESAEKCTPTANTNCSCLPGFLCSNNACSKCEENKCVSGEKPKRTESVRADGLILYSYQCEPLCPDNTHFDKKEGICETLRQGRDSINLILGIGFVLLSLILLVFLSHALIKTLRKHKAYKTPVEVLAVSTNATDYRLSKEESGVELTMQDETKKSNSLSLVDLDKVSSYSCSGVPEQDT